MNAVREKILEIIANELDLELSEVNENSSINATPNWDSMAIVYFKVDIEEQFQIKLDTYRYTACKNAGEIIALVESTLQGEKN